jgi:uncharacterized protein YbaP (TraB family)
LLLVLVFGVACGSSAPRCTIDVPKPADPQPFLWKAEKDGNVVWLYGTIHNGGKAEVPPAAWTALTTSTRFASELGDAEPDKDRVAKLVRIESGKTLDFLLPPDDWYDLRDIMRGTVKEEDLKHFRPWYAMIRLTQKISPPPETTMDNALTERAKEAGKPIDALERVDEQLMALANAVGVADLRDALAQRDKMKCELDGMLAFYVTGDVDAMKKWLAMEHADVLLGARNKKWLARVESYFATGGAFVAVGLGHLIGDQSLLELLAAKGYKVERARSSR